MKIALLMIASALFGWAETALACRVMQAPLEQFFGAWFRGPTRVDIASHANAWAGRTTLVSGSATVAISTSNVKSDSLIFFNLEGNANLSSGTAIRPIEVKTISEGGYFTAGTQDGVAIPRNTTIMWEIRLPGKTSA